MLLKKFEKSGEQLIKKKEEEATKAKLASIQENSGKIDKNPQTSDSKNDKKPEDDKQSTNNSNSANVYQQKSFLGIGANKLSMKQQKNQQRKDSTNPDIIIDDKKEEKISAEEKKMKYELFQRHSEKKIKRRKAQKNILFADFDEISEDDEEEEKNFGKPGKDNYKGKNSWKNSKKRIFSETESFEDEKQKEIQKKKKEEEMLALSEKTTVSERMAKRRKLNYFDDNSQLFS